MNRKTFWNIFILTLIGGELYLLAEDLSKQPISWAQILLDFFVMFILSVFLIYNNRLTSIRQ